MDYDARETQHQTEAEIISLLRNKMNITVDPCDIEACHRLGIFSRDADRPVIIHFVRRKTKIVAITNRRKLKGQREVITEDLTHSNLNKIKIIKISICRKRCMGERRETTKDVRVSTL